MNTESLVNKCLLRESFQFEQGMSTTDKVIYWVHKHPTVIKTIEAIGMILGVGSVAALPVSLAAIGNVAILIAIGGGIIGLASAIAYEVLDILIPPDHDMHHHVFKPASYGVGHLYYQGDVPILELNYDDPRQAGLAHGYLMGEYLDRLLRRLNFVKNIAHLPQARDIPGTIEAIRQTIPQEYLEEMKGIVEGFNKWGLERKWLKAKTMTLDDLLLFHLMPDSIHFSPEQLENTIQPENGRKNPVLEQKSVPSLACTVVIDRDVKEGIVFGRNMDWPSFGIFGAYSLMINRKQTGRKLSTVEVGLPGFVGTITGMNSITTKGLRLPKKEEQKSRIENCVRQILSLAGGQILLHNRRLVNQPELVEKKLHSELQNAQDEMETGYCRDWDSPHASSLMALEVIKQEQHPDLHTEMKAGIASIQGRRPSMEDAHLATELHICGKNIPLYGVFDGHGGKECAEFLKNRLSSYLEHELAKVLAEQDPKMRDSMIFNCLKLACVDLGEMYRKEHPFADAGSTANFVLIIDETLWNANVGDTRAILVRKKNPPIALSQDAKPAMRKFQRGAIKRGGKIMQSGPIPRIFPRGLAVARAVGHPEIRSGINPRAKITKFPLENLSKKPAFLLIGCDGLWDVASSSQVANTIQKMHDQAPEKIAEHLVLRAYAAGSRDNVSALIVSMYKSSGLPSREQKLQPYPCARC